MRTQHCNQKIMTVQPSSLVSVTGVMHDGIKLRIPCSYCSRILSPFHCHINRTEADNIEALSNLQYCNPYSHLDTSHSS